MLKNTWGLILLSLILNACGGTDADRFVSASTHVPLALRNYEIVQHGLRADVCKLSVMGFGRDDTSYARAIKQLHSRVPKRFGADYQLVNVVEDGTFEFYLFAWKNCTVLSADVAVLKQPIGHDATSVPPVQPSVEPTPVPAEPPPAEETLSAVSPLIISNSICSKLSTCDPGLTKRTFQTYEWCSSEMQRNNYSPPTCPAFNPSQAGRCLVDLMAMDCSTFIAVITQKIPDTSSCATLCGK